MGQLFSSDLADGSAYEVERRLPNISIALTAPPEQITQSINTLCSRRKGIEKLIADAQKLQDTLGHDAAVDEQTRTEEQQSTHENDFVTSLKERLASLDTDILTLRRMKLEAEAAEIISGKRDTPTTQPRTAPDKKKPHPPNPPK
jgi:hypothetical protein